MYRREPSVAGAFYPSNADKLRREIDAYLEEVKGKQLENEIVALVVPHAGYVYSGPVAAFAYKQLQDRPIERAVVLAPSHRARFDGASVMPEGVYVTPLGEVEVDKEVCQQLLAEKQFTFLQRIDEAEHSLEVQIPFLQRVLKNFKLIPIIIGCTELDKCATIAQSLVSVLKNFDSYVMVLSTDLSHYFSYQKARAIDAEFIKTLETFDENDLFELLSSGRAQACGEGAVLTGMIASKGLGAKEVKILQYATSGDTAGGKDQVVGYLSAAFVK
ncbi:MAG: AmmeMemoRadiSam system protein B [Spirochaetes bacterium]|nr:AmmeMemoRadiSam system protein B [Spirochaetota bacterium]